MRVYARTALFWDGDKLRLGPRGRKLAEIVVDDRYPTMWRIVRPDGSLTDMVNRTRAKDAAEAMALGALNMGQETG